MYLRITICDDDAVCREQVAEIINNYTKDRNVSLSLSVFDSPDQLLQAARENKGFDIYILDIIMPGTTGIQLGGKLRQEGFEGKILYLTSSAEFAIDAFKVQASDYIMKPVKAEELTAALDRLISAVTVRKEKCLIIKSKDSNIKVSFDQILYTELVQKTIVYYLLNGKRVESSSIRSTFSEAMQDLLRDRRFSLCGSGRVVNLDYIVEMDAENLIFKNGTQVYIGRRAVREIRSVWYDFWFDGGE